MVKLVKLNEFYKFSVVILPFFMHVEIHDAMLKNIQGGYELEEDSLMPSRTHHSV